MSRYHREIKRVHSGEYVIETSSTGADVNDDGILICSHRVVPVSVQAYSEGKGETLRNVNRRLSGRKAVSWLGQWAVRTF